MSFAILQNQKTPFQDIKKRSKSRKIDSFPKRLTHGFGPKIAIFQAFFFRQYRPGKCLLRYYRTKKHLSRIYKKREKVEQLTFFQSGFGPKIAIFRTLFFQGIQARKMSFTIFQNQKTPFKAIKTQSSKSRKVDIFPKGLTNGFGSKMVIFPTSFLGNISQENVFYDILEPINTFLGYKNEKIKKSKKLTFFQRVNPCFWSKNGHFTNFSFFRQCRPGKCLLRYSRTKKHLSRL